MLGRVIVPSETAAPKQLSPSEYCEQAVPWYCGTWGFPGLVNTFSDRRCDEAWSLYDGCMAGGFNRHLATSRGAPKAPPVAARPGVNYNDPAVLRSIQSQNEAQSLLDWQSWIDANKKLISGAPWPTGDDEANPTGTPWLLLGMIAAAFLLLLALMKK